jgi:NADPH:quinone reductase-like Zn-dependent oxidoreductase
MRSLRFHSYGAAADVLRLDEVEVPTPGAGHIRVQVHACGLNPADWALCVGLFATALPRGVGLDVSGRVDAVGEGVTDVHIGDLVLGAADFSNYPSAGASDRAILRVWTPVPDGLGLTEAAALPMAVETAYRAVDLLGVAAGQTLLVYGAGTMMGFAAVQMARMRGARVIAAAGDTFAADLRDLGAVVTPYSEGMVERVLEINGGPPDLILDTGLIQYAGSKAGGLLPDLIRIAGGDAGRVLTISNHGDAAAELGVRNSFGALRYDVLPDFARHAAEGRFRVPIGRALPLDDWREALALSLAGRAHGKLMLMPAATPEAA